MDEMLGAYRTANEFRYSDKRRYTKILNEYYREESFRRTKLFHTVENDKELELQVKRHISQRENIPDFMCDWCWTFDPRLSAVGLPTALPWIPFPRQLEFIEWFYNLYLNQESGLVEKSRDMGVTWLFCLIFLFEWRWDNGFIGGFGSNKLDNVDKRDDPDSIFEKIRKLIELLPKWWYPKNFDWKRHDKIGNLVNPEKNSQLSGQGGRDIGRGGRKSAYLVDESASLEFPDAADAALSATTACQIDLSTPKGMNKFGQKRFSGRVKVFTFNWKDDPRKNEKWYDHEKSRLDPVILAQEIDINYHASVEGLFIKPEWVQAAVDIDLKPEGMKAAGLDVAAGGSNKSSLALRFGPVVLVNGFNIPNGVDLTHMSIDLCNKHEVAHLHYDQIGVGHAVYSTIQRSEKQMIFSHFGMKASSSPSDNYYEELKGTGKECFSNARSEWWYLLSRRFEKTWEHVNKVREYDESELISIENNGNLIAQLSSPKKFYLESGKIACESKDAMLKRGIQSPDEADAVVLAFIPRAGGIKRVLAGLDGQPAVDVKIDWALPTYKIRHYGALVISKDLSVHFLGAVWDSVEGKLKFYTDDVFKYPDPAIIVDTVISKMGLRHHSLDRLLGNQVMFKENRRSFHREINKQFWDKMSYLQTINVREPRKYDQFGAVGELIRLVENGCVEISRTCEQTQKQFSLWQLRNNRFEHDGLQEAALLIMSELMLYTPYKETVHKKPEYLPVHQPHELPGGSDPMGV
jgi:hypothetical protein